MWSGSSVWSGSSTLDALCGPVCPVAPIVSEVAVQADAQRTQSLWLLPLAGYSRHGTHRQPQQHWLRDLRVHSRWNQIVGGRVCQQQTMSCRDLHDEFDGSMRRRTHAAQLMTEAERERHREGLRVLRLVG